MKIIFITGITIILLGFTAKSSSAFDRNAYVSGARSVVNVNYTYNVITNIVNAGPVKVGSSDKSLPAYRQISQINAQIQALKERLKNYSIE